MQLLNSLVLFSYLLLLNGTGMESKIVEIPDGLLKGYQSADFDEKPFFSFLGIPYAEPPVGELKFRAPLPVHPWKGIRDCTTEGNICLQKNFKTNTLVGSEDCLNLNLFTRELPKANGSLKPVMVWIHGGKRCTGSNRKEVFGPEYLMTQDIVLVVINYRLGFLGFLQLNDDSLDVPGNAGLKDQRLALKWVAKNAQYFGGDPNDVTLFGNSAGGFFVHFHMLSPSSRGLFHKAIMQSGTAVVPAYGYQNPYEFLEQMGHKVTTDRDVLKIFQSLSHEELIERQAEYLKLFKSTIGPTIEKPNKSVFLSEAPTELFFSGNYTAVPVMLGYNSNEEIIFLGENEKPDPNIFVPYEMKLEKGNRMRKSICKMLSDFYYEGIRADQKYLIYADAIFLSNIVITAKQLAKSSSPVYVYRFSVDGGLNYYKKIMKYDGTKGTCHSDEIGYIFNVTCVPGMTMGKYEERAVRNIVKLWTNFAKFGNPTPDDGSINIQWNPIGKEFNVLDIGDELVMRNNPEAERMELWKTIYHLLPSTSGLM